MIKDGKSIMNSPNSTSQCFIYTDVLLLAVSSLHSSIQYDGLFIQMQNPVTGPKRSVDLIHFVEL